MIATPDVAWRGDLGVTYADPDEVLDPCAFSIAYPLYSADSEISTESSENRQWSCRLSSCVPPLGLVSASLGLQLAAGVLLFAAATNGHRLHYLTPSFTDHELPFIHANYAIRDPKTYAWCLAYVLAGLLVFFTLISCVAAAIAIGLGCCKWARILRAMAILQSFISAAAALACGTWLAGYAVSQSGLTSAAVKNFLKTFNYGTLLFARSHEVMLRAAGTLAAAGCAASARAARATCHDTAVGATTTCFALILAWAVSFLLMHAALGGMAPPVFGVPALLVAFACLMQLNFGCCERWKHTIMMVLFLLSMFVALVAWEATQETYGLVFSLRSRKETSLVKRLKRLVDLRQWARALGGSLGVGAFVGLAAAQAIFCLFAAMVMFMRAFGKYLTACRRKRRQKRRDKEICEAQAHCLSPCGAPAAVVTTYSSPAALSPGPVVLPPASSAPSRTILVPPPPHAVFS